MEPALAIGVNLRLTAGGSNTAMLAVALRHAAGFADRARSIQEIVSVFAAGHQRLTIQDIEKAEARTGTAFAS
jgi:hypothetical protein